MAIGEIEVDCLVCRIAHRGKSRNLFIFVATSLCFFRYFLAASRSSRGIAAIQ